MLIVIGVIYEILYVKLKLELSVLFLLEEAYCLGCIKYFVYHPMHHTAGTSSLVRNHISVQYVKCASFRSGNHTSIPFHLVRKHTDMPGIQVGAVSI